MTKIIYTSQHNVDNIDEVFNPCNAVKNDWWQNLSPFITNSKSLKEWFAVVTKNKHWSPSDPNTIKTCPGLADLFKSSFIWKMPCDLLLKISDDGNAWQTPQTDLLKLDSHSDFQYTNRLGQTIYKQKINIKFETPFLIHADRVLKYIPSAAAYHNSDIDYDVMPGVVTLSNNVSSPLNLNLMFDRKENIYEFKKGQPIAYFTFMSDKLPKLVYNPDSKCFTKNRTKFFGYYKYEI